MTTPDLVCISLYAENQPGVLGRVAAAFTRRRINIESLLVARSGVEGLHRFTVCVEADARQVDHVVRQLARQVDVLSVRVHPAQETTLRGLTLYRLAAGVGRDMALQAVARRWAARFVHADERCTILEHTGTPEQSRSLLEALAPWEVLELAESGAVALDHSPDAMQGVARPALVSLSLPRAFPAPSDGGASP